MSVDAAARPDLVLDGDISGDGVPPESVSGRQHAADPITPTQWPRPWAPPADQLPSATVQTSARRYLVAAAWIIGLGAAAVIGRTALPELRDATRAIADAHPGWLMGALALQVVALLVLPMPFRGALEALGGRAGYRALLDATLGAFALSRIVPAGGLAGGAYAVRRIVTAGNAAAVAVAAVAAASVVTMLSLGVVVVGGAAVDALTGQGSPGVAWATLAGLVLAGSTCGTLVWLLHRPERVDRTAARLARRIRRPTVAHTVRRQLAVVGPLLERPAPLLRVAGWAAVNWSLQLAALWTVFLAFGLSMPLGVLIMGFGAANLATALPHTPGGIGVVEAGMTATYVAMGVPTSTALVGVVCYRLIGHWLPVLAALPLVVSRSRPQPGEFDR